MVNADGGVLAMKVYSILAHSLVKKLNFYLYLDHKMIPLFYPHGNLQISLYDGKTI